MTVRTIEVRILVAIDTDGRFCAYGTDSEIDARKSVENELHQRARAEHRERTATTHIWVTATVPYGAEIVGTVEANE